MLEQIPFVLLDKQFNRIYKQFSPSFQEQINEHDFTALATEFIEDVSQFEMYSSLSYNGIEERIWLNPSKDKGLSVMVDDRQTIVGMQVVELNAAIETDQQLSLTTFNLPFQGDWFTFGGGNNVLANYHYAHESQRYAYDFLRVQDGYSFEGDPSLNESYYAFGEPVIAPADGVIVAVVNDIADNEPVGVMNESEPAGNVVIIDHGNDEFSILAHLKIDSILVNVGDQVQQGEQVGQVGNSGNSSEAHLHFQVSNGSDLFASQSIQINWDSTIHAIRGTTISTDK